MASEASSDLRIELMKTGEKPNTWGDATNVNLQILERAIKGYIEFEILAPVTTLTALDFVLSTWHNMVWKLTGALTSDSTLIVPSFAKVYLMENATTGNYALVVRTAGGTGIAIPPGQRALLTCDRVNVTGTVLQPYASGLSSIGAFQAGGFAARKANGTWAPRVLEGTEDQITVSDGNGDLKNPKLSLPTKVVLPGTLETKGGVVVDAGGLTIQGGNFTLTGANATGFLRSTSGFGSLEVSGPTGAQIDLKNPDSDDYDIRLNTDGAGGALTVAGGDLVLRNAGSGVINFTIGTTGIASVTGGGLGVYTGLIDLVAIGAGDSRLQWRNANRTWDAGVRNGGGWSLRNNGVDTLIVNPDNTTRVPNFLNVTNGNLSVDNGNLYAGTIDLRGDLYTRGMHADAGSRRFFLRDGGLGIDASLPQQIVHIGNLGNQRNSIIRTETGGPLGFRGWDFGTVYGDFGFIINDVTGGVRRFTIDWRNGMTTLNGGVNVIGTGEFSGRIGASGGLGVLGVTSLSKNGSGTALTIVNPNNTGGDGCQVHYNGQRANVYTRVRQEAGAALGQFEFLNTSYTTPTFIITQDGRALNPSGVYAAISDRRLKENIAPAGDYLEALCQLEVVDYSLIQDARPKANRIGFVAQQVEGILPRLVDETEWQGNTRKTINSSDLVPMLVRAVQELYGMVRA